MFDRFRTFLITAAALVAGASLVSPARAAWSGFTTMGPTVIISNVSCAGLSQGNAVCVGIGASSDVLVNIFDGASVKWSGWRAYASSSSNKLGVATSDPSCTNITNVSGANYVDCGVRDAAMRLEPFYIAFGSTTTLSVFPPIDLALGSAPSCAQATLSSTVACVGQSTTGALVGAFTNAGQSSSGAWQVIPSPSLASPVESPVNCMVYEIGNEQIVCVWATTDNQMGADYFTGSAWQGITYLGGDLSHPPNCASLITGGACFATGTNSAVFWNALFNTSPWSGWSSLGGAASSYSCTGYIAFDTQAGGGANLLCGAISITDSAFFTNQNANLTGWGSWTEQFGGLDVAPTFVRNPSCLKLAQISNLASPEVMCVLVKPNGQTVSITGP